MSELSRRALLRSGLVLSASSLAARSSWGLAFPRFAAEQETTCTACAPRERFSFDREWKFLHGNAADPARDLGFGNDQGAFAKSGDFKFATADFDDEKWRTLNLPHDWAVELPFVHDDNLQSHGYKPLGRHYPENSVGWYRREFDIPKQDLGRRITVDFDGIFRSALIFVNGFFIGRHDDGYSSFSFDLTDFLNYGGKNFLVVRVDASFGDGWFYEGAGIYRHVWLTKTDPVHLVQWESFVRTDVKGSEATLTLGTLVKNEGEAVDAVHVTWKIVGADGTTVAQASSAPQALPNHQPVAFAATATVPTPRLWSPETPTLYKAIVSVESASGRHDAEQVTFGIRTIAFDVDKGFFLNGKSVKIKGTCNHQDHAGVGAALPDRLQSFRLAVLKEMGGNAVRTSHNPPTPEWVEACDRMGMMMLFETRSMSSNPEALAELDVMVKRFRNSPAIILWSMGNEEWELQKDEQGQRVMAAMVQRTHELDPTRLCTAAVNGSYDGGISLALDVEGINYNLNKVDDYRKTHPKRPLIGSETASTIATRGSYITDTLRNLVSAYDLNYPPWAETAEQWWKFYASREWLAGGFAWTGFDYRGEPTPYGWPSINSQFGIVDMCGFPKDDFFYYKAWWGQEPVLHLFPHWNWEERIGEPVSVWVHSNLDEVELFLNGKSLGTKNVEPLTHLEWKVKYEPGTLEARGRKNGKIVLTEKRETTGAPSSIKLSADRLQIDADGSDLSMLRVEALDKQGRPVPTASNEISFRVTGNGSLIGVGNGDPNCQESDKEPVRSLFNGLAQAIIQASRTPGEIVIEAFTKEGAYTKLTSASLTITSRKTELKPEIL